MPPPPPPFAPSIIATGDDALIMVSGDMMSWTEVTQAISTIPATLDLDKVVKVPGTSRVVVIANTDSAVDDTNASIYYNNSNGSGAWTAATIVVDARHQAAAADDDWNLNDMFFVDTNEGYAVGNNWVILRTLDGGLNWTDMNSYQDGAGTINFQELELAAAPSADFQLGETINGGAAGVGTLIAWSEFSDTMVIDVTTPGTSEFVDSEAITGATSGSTGTLAGAGVGVTNALWHYYARNNLSLYVTVETDGTHHVFMGQDGFYYTDGENAVPGIWRIVSNATTTPASRTFSWFGPHPNEQRGAGEISETSEDIRGLFFFDEVTGVASTGDGVWYTEGGTGEDWTQFTATTNNESYYGFCYSSTTLASTGYLYTVEDIVGSEYPVRCPVTYTAGAWDIDETTGWVNHGDTLRYDLDSVEYSVSSFPYDGKIFVIDYGSTANASWGWGNGATSATFDTTLWQDTTEQYMGGNNTFELNPAYQKGILEAAGAPAGTIRSLARR